MTEEKMSIEQAIRLLHPETTAAALAEVEYYGGFNGNAACIEAINDACIVACEAMEKQIPKKYISIDSPYMGQCPVCCSTVWMNSGYCWKCGQRMDWSDE